MCHSSQTARQGFLCPSLDNAKEHWAFTVFCSMDKSLPTSIPGCRTLIFYLNICHCDSPMAQHLPDPGFKPVSVAPQILPSCDFDDPSLVTHDLIYYSRHQVTDSWTVYVSLILKNGSSGSSEAYSHTLAWAHEMHHRSSFSRQTTQALNL